MVKGKRILVCPLNWGLGHATRCIPIIHHLLSTGQEVIIGGSGESLVLLKEEFRDLPVVQFPDYTIKYSQSSQLWWRILTATPRLLAVMRAEHVLLEEKIKQLGIEGVISDHRYGLWSEQIPSVFLGHQLCIQAPIGKAALFRMNMYLIQRFTHLWVPDFQGAANLSGKLSHDKRLPENAQFIGPLSRFSQTTFEATSTKKYDVVAVLSGPEPQRSILENKIRKSFYQSELSCAIVEGKPSSKASPYVERNTSIFPYLNSTELLGLIEQSELVISRSGYSSIMDWVALRKNAILVPTPGQTEQEYLADYLQEKGYFFSLQQKAFDLKTALESSRQFSLPTEVSLVSGQLEGPVNEFVEML